MQFAEYDSIAEARGLSEEDAKAQVEEQKVRLAEEQAERERYEATPEFQRARKKRRRNKKIKNVAMHTALSPLYVIVGVSVVAGLVIAAPFAIAGAALSKVSG